jgi:hypothetical protein
MSDEYEEEEAAPPPKPKRPRRPIDWTLWIMLLGTLAFVLIFGAITLLAPRRPFMALRGIGAGIGGRPAATAVATKPADPAAKPADPGAKPADPAAKPADPAAKPAAPPPKPADTKPAAPPPKP